MPSMQPFSDQILDELIRVGQLDESERMEVRQVLLRRHTHQYEQVRATPADQSARATPLNSHTSRFRLNTPPT